MFNAIVMEQVEQKVTAGVQALDESRLPEGDVSVAVEYSTVNYKDGLIVNGLGGLVKTYPHVPGIDFAGTVEASRHPRFRPGDKVVLNGWRVGELHWGGFAQKARVSGDWLVPVPAAFTTRQAMGIGTAGYTAMLAIMALEDHDVTPAKGEVLVTGAAGGVGSVAIAILATLGYRVAAATGRPETRGYLTDLGATSIVDRAELEAPSNRPLEGERWAGCIDNVGGTTLARVLAQMKYAGAVAAVGLAGGAKLETTVMPFLLRGANLLGIDSVMCPSPRREASWIRLAKDLPVPKLEATMSPARLADVPRLAAEILQGRVRGRVVVDVNA